jgi:hypothetical protein
MIACLPQVDVDVNCPWMRRICILLFIPTTLMLYFFLFIIAEMYGSDAIQHKFYQPFLIGVLMLFTLSYGYCCLSAGERMLSNITLFVGCPVYFTLFYSAAFITLVPGYNWVTFFDNILVNMQMACDWFAKLTGMIFNLSIVVFVLAYREKLLRFMGLDTVQLVRLSMWDIADPTYRERSFIPIKVAIKRVHGRLPAGDASTRSNDLYVEIRLGDNEPVNTRVHNMTVAEQDCDVFFDEVLQINIPKDRYSMEKMIVLVKDQDVVGAEEIARKVFSVREIYETWFNKDANYMLYTADKSIVSDPRQGLQIIKDGHVCHQAAFRDYALSFLAESANAVLTVAMLPADARACDHCASQGGLGNFFSEGLFGSAPDGAANLGYPGPDQSLLGATTRTMPGGGGYQYLQPGEP